AAGWRLVRAVPERVGAAAFRAAADAAYLRGGPAVRRLRANLRRVVGPQPPDAELDRLVRAGLRSYARYWLEAFRLPAFTPAQIRQRFRLAGEELLAKAMARSEERRVGKEWRGRWGVEQARNR